MVTAVDELTELTLPDTAEQSLGYKIIRGVDMLDLADAVNSSIASGWVPIGGVCHVPPGFLDLQPGVTPHPFWQAMTREKAQ